MSIPSFEPAREQDAWGAIRGFVYQVDLTVLRWLHLSADEVLELERGEDIDTIQEAVLADRDERSRLLEQVKHREGNLTLRRAAALAALVNAHEHQQANRSLRIFFRFTTNAQVGRERPCPMPARMPAIEAWELVRTGQMGPTAEPEVFEGLRSVIRDATRPADIPKPSWETFQAYWTGLSDSEIKEFISRFEWATLAPAAKSLRPRIQRWLLERGHAVNSPEAEALYERLFASVFTRLASPGIKRLTHTDLEATIAGGALTPGERALVHRLHELHEVLEARVGTLEQQVRSIEGALATTNSRLDQMADAAGIRASFDPASVSPPVFLGEPPLVEHASRRRETVQHLLPANARPGIVALHGPAASGKTQLALLLAREFGERHAWIRFPVDDAGDASARIVAAIRARSASTSGDWETQCRTAVSGLDVVVLDGVPPFKEGDALGLLLLPLIRTCQDEGVSVITTSEVPLATTALTGLEPSILRSPMPPMVDGEVREVLLQYGAPESRLSAGFVTVVTAVTSGQPVLVQAAGQFLAGRDWVLDADLLGDLLRRAYAEEVNTETTRVLLQEIADPPTRELLYRLTLLVGEFGRTELDLLANVPPRIGAMRERFSHLLGPWVQPVVEGRYVLSPLVNALGAEDLDPDARRECHRVLAGEIVSRARIGPWELGDAIRHFSAAGDYDAAGLSLVRGLYSLHTSGVLRGPDGRPSFLTRLWRDAPLPVEMDLGLRMHIHAYQAVLAMRLGEDPEALLQDLDVLLGESADAPAWSIFGATALVALEWMRQDLARALPYVERAFEAWPKARALFEAGPGHEEKQPPGFENVLWIAGGAVRDADDLERWSDILRGLPPEQLAHAFASQTAQQACAVLANKPVLWEYQRRRGEEDWDTAVATIQRLESTAEEIGARTLVAACRSALIVALGEGKRDLVGAEAITEQTLTEFQDMPDGAFLAAKAMGYSLMDAGHPSDAERWLRRANGLPGRLHGRERVLVKLWLATLVGERDPGTAVAFAEEAARLALRTPGDLLRLIEEEPHEGDRSGEVLDTSVADASDLMVVQAHAELALARWFAGDRKGAARAWQTVADRLLSGRADRDVYWKSLFAMVGHAGGYLAAIAATGEPPPPPPGDEVHAAPWRGMFLARPHTAAMAFQPNAVGLLAVHTAQFTAGVGDDAAAQAWAERSIEMLKASGQWSATIGPLLLLVRLSLLAGRFRDAIRDMTELAAVMWAVRDTPLEEFDPLATSAAPSTVLGPRGSDAWAGVEATVFTGAVLPAFLRIADEMLLDEERGRTLAGGLRNACLEEAEGSPMPELWQTAARLCEETFLSPVDYGELMARARELQARPRSAEYSLSVLAHFGACVRAPRPREALWLQLHAAEFLQRQVGEGEGMLEAIVLPYFTAYWSKQLECNRIHFLAPTLISREVQRISANPPRERLPRLLRAIADGLGIQVPEGVQQFITPR